MPLFPLIVAIILALGGGTATLANSAKPGDTLYPLDQWVEHIQEKFASNPEARTKLLAKFADERVAELADIEKVDASKLTLTAQQLWEKHRQEAIDRVTTSIAKVTANQDKFKEWLTAETDADKKAILQKIITHLDEVKAKREARLAELQAKIFPPAPVRDLKEDLKKAREDHKDELEAIREQAKQDWEKIREARKQELEKSDDNSAASDTDKDKEDNADDKSSDNPSSTPGSTGTSNQTTLEFRVPIDENGNINWDDFDTDHDGIPDRLDKDPNWPAHTMGANA